MANKISVILDVATEKGVGALKGFKQSIADADGAFGKMKAGGASAFDSLKANAGAATVAVGAAVVAMGAKAIGAASDLAESVNAVNVSFGPTAEGIKKLGEEAAESVGLSNAQFNALAVQFSSFATTIAGEKGNVVGTIDEMTTRIADFASVMNLDVPEAARVFQSALAGETEPIKKFGIDLSAAEVKAHALETGIIDVGDALTGAEKVQATYSLLMQKTDQVSGDFATTSDGLANSQRILKAKVEDAAAVMGNALVPILADVVGGIAAITDVAAPAVGALDGLMETAKQVSYNIGSFFGKLATPFTGSFIPEQSLTDLEHIDERIDAVFETMAAGAGTMEEFTANLDKAGITGYERSLLILKFRDSLDAADASTSTFTGSLLANAEALIKQTTDAAAVDAAMVSLKDAIDKEKDAQEKAEEKAKAHTAALEAQITATDELFSSKQALVGGDIAVRDSQRQAGEAVAALNTLTEEGKIDTDEYVVAQDGAAESLLGAAQAAADYQIAQSEANGETLSGESKANIFKLKLQELADTLLPGSPLRAMIDGYIADLGAIPSEVRTNLRVTGAVTTRDGDLIGVRPIDTGIGMYEKGGMVPGPVGKPQLAIVHGGEEVLTPAQQNAAGGLGNSTINFYSNGPPTLADLSHAFAMLRLSR